MRTVRQLAKRIVEGQVIQALEQAHVLQPDAEADGQHLDQPPLVPGQRPAATQVQQGRALPASQTNGDDIVRQPAFACTAAFFRGFLQGRIAHRAGILAGLRGMAARGGGDIPVRRGIGFVDGIAPDAENRIRIRLAQQQGQLLQGGPRESLDVAPGQRPGAARTMPSMPWALSRTARICS